MRHLLIALCLCLTPAPLGGCATTTVGAPPPSAIERATAGYARVRVVAVAALPYLPPITAQRVRAGIALADAALAIVNSNATPDQRVEALRQLAGQIAALAVAIR